MDFGRILDAEIARQTARTPFADAVDAFAQAVLRAALEEPAFEEPPVRTPGGGFRAARGAATANTARAEPPAWARVLGVEVPCTERALRAAFRRRAFETHPDRGGSADAFLRAQRALDDGLAALRAA